MSRNTRGESRRGVRGWFFGFRFGFALVRVGEISTTLELSESDRVGDGGLSSNFNFEPKRADKCEGESGRSV